MRPCFALATSIIAIVIFGSINITNAQATVVSRGTSFEDSSDSPTKVVSRGTSFEDSSDSQTKVVSRGTFDESASFASPPMQFLPLQQPVSAPGSPGDTRITYSTPAGYVPAYGDPISIKKKIVPMEIGKGVGIGGKLRVESEITYLKRGQTRSQVDDLDIYEIVDDDLSIVPENDSLVDIPLIFFNKMNRLEEISDFRLDLFRVDPLDPANAAVNNGIYSLKGTDEDSSYLDPGIHTHYVFEWDNTSEDEDDQIPNLLNYLKNYYDVEWADSSLNGSCLDCSILRKDDKNITINYINERNQTKLKVVMYNDSIIITNSDNKYEIVELHIKDEMNDKGRIFLNISGRNPYYLNFNKTKTGNRLIYDRSGFLRFHVKSLSTKDRLFYWYYVQPKKSGSFSTESIIRIKDKDYTGWPDIIYPFEIGVYEPDLKYEVIAVPEIDRVYENDGYLVKLGGYLRQFQLGIGNFFRDNNILTDQLKIRYIVSLAADASRPYTDSIEITMDSPTDDWNYTEENGAWIDPLNFSDNRVNIIIKNITYNNSGTYPIPGMWIEGRLYSFKDKVTVDDPLTRNKDLIGVILLLLGLIYRNKLKEFLDSLCISLKRKVKIKIKNIRRRIKSRYEELS